MGKILSLLIIILFLTTSCLRTTFQSKVCRCCDLTFTNLDSAVNCIIKNPEKTSSIDNRLFLFVIVSKDIAKYQNLGWKVLKDEEIIKIAKRNYLLLILDESEVISSKTTATPELKEMLERHNENIFFIITNQALYPFASWSPDEDRKKIIENLEVGNGP